MQDGSKNRVCLFCWVSASETEKQKKYGPLSASDSVGMMRFFEGVEGVDSSMRWYEVRISPVSRDGTKRSP